MSSANHTFSVVVNTVDRSRPLQTLLRALEHQSYPHFELIVVVGPTQDDTLDRLDPFAARLTLLRCPTANLSVSRNIGLRAARGDIVAFIDDDAVPSYHWLAQLNRLFADQAVSGTGGKVYRITPDKPLLQHYLGITSGLAEQVDVRSSWVDRIVPPGDAYQWQARMMGTNMAFRRQDLLTVGGFDEFFQWVYDDSDLSLRLADAGKIIHPVKEAVVYHAPASSRNRQVHTSVGNWWIQTKASVYFSLKHGRRGGNSRRDTLLRCLHLWHGHLLWYGRLRREKKLTAGQHWRMRWLEARGATAGAVAGLQHAKAPQQPLPDSGAGGAIRPFQNADSPLQPTVDPVNGHLASVTIPDQPLRLCLLSMAYPPAKYEGVGRLTNLMAQGLFELGHTVHVIAGGAREEVSFYDGAYVHRLPFQRRRYGQYRLYPRLFNVLNYSHTVYERVRQLRFNDGIQLVDSPLWQMDGLVTAVSGMLPVMVRLLTAVKQIADLQQQLDPDSRLLGEMERTLIQKADHIAPNTLATLNNVQKVYDVDFTPEAYTVLPYGIVPVPEGDVRPFPIENPPATLTVLFVGRLEKRKGIRDLFGAIPRVLEQVSPVRFIIVGADNSAADGFLDEHGLDYQAYFKQKHPELMTTVTFTGAVSDSELNRHYQACDLFVAPSLYESFGLIYLEAMNYAKPVIGCNAGGIPEVIDNGVTGLLAEPAAPASLAEAITSLLQSPQKMADMGRAGRAQLMAKFTHVQMAGQFATVYRRLVGTRAHKHESAQ